ncbi:MAG: TatD family hydrolase [Parvularculaceae bacterium]
MLVDSHVNLHGDPYADDLDEVLERAKQAGVGAMLTISDKLSSVGAISAISEVHAHIWHTVGAHPHHAKDHGDLTKQTLCDLAKHPKAVGIGECGLDFYYGYSDPEIQEQVFRAHIAAARETGLPLIIHTRDADELMSAVLRDEYQKGAFTPLMHCYTSGMALADLALEQGGYVSFSGILTFKKADNVKEIAQSIPLDRLLIETDCPFLAPMPYRGKRCEPAFVREVCDKLAEIKQVSSDEMAKITTDNFFRLFSKIDRTSLGTSI